MTARDANSTEVKKLTKRKRDTDELYNRRNEVESQIEVVCSLHKSRIPGLLKNRERNSDGYLFDETLVYLLRENGDDPETIEVIYSELNRRIWSLLRKFYKYFNDSADFEDFGQKTEMAIIKKIFDRKSDSADYAQVNFGDFVVTQAKSLCRQELVKLQRERETFDFMGREDSDTSADRMETEISSGDAPADFKLVLREGISKLPPHIMTAAELLLDGWQIESKEADEPTISKKLGVSSRTIRNWLRQGREILAGYQGEVRR